MLVLSIACCFLSLVSRSFGQDDEYRGTAKNLSSLLTSGEALQPKHVVFWDEEVHPKDLDVIGKRCELDSVVLGEFPDEVKLSNRSIQKLVAIESLKELSLYVSSDGDLTWNELSKLTNLKNLSLMGDVTFSNGSLGELSKIQELVSLELNGTFESAKSLEFLTDLKNLESLVLGTRDNELDPVEIIKTLKGLKRLELSIPQGLNAKQVEEIASSVGANIELLDVVLVDVESLEQLKLFSNLTTLRISWREPTSIDSRFVANNPKLKSMTMYNCVIETSKAKEMAKAHGTLERLVISPELNTSRALFWQKERKRKGTKEKKGDAAHY